MVNAAYNFAVLIDSNAKRSQLLIAFAMHCVLLDASHKEMGWDHWDDPVCQVKVGEKLVVEDTSCKLSTSIQLHV